MHIDQMIDPGLLADMIEQGYIREQRHPSYPYRILNYTEHAQFDREWNEATLQCRGLVIDEDGNVIARPFRKFFNDTEHLGEHLPALDLAAPVEVTDKMDGSLGILVPTTWGPIIATRGSFQSEQAIWATNFYNQTWPFFHPRPGLTYLMEIIYSANRIVVDYGFSDLVLLGAIDIETGNHIPARDLDWPGRKVEQFDYRTLAEALAAPPRTNAEGFVVRYLDGSGQMVKIKLAEYIRLHKLVTGLSERAVWEHMSTDGRFEDLVANLPDEFHRWVTDVWDNLWTEFDGISGEATYRYMRILASLAGTERDDRKTFARHAVAHGDFAPLLFLLYDGNEAKYDAAIFKRIRPEGDTRMWTNQENAA
jgi:RNA ligase